MALPALPASNAALAKAEVRSNIADAQNLEQINLSSLRNTFLDSIDQTLIKMFDLQQAKFNQEMLDRQKALADAQASGRDRTVDGDDVSDNIKEPGGAVKNLLRLAALAAALGGAFVGLRGFTNPIRNAELAMKALRAIYVKPITFFKNLGVKVGNLLKFDVAFENLKRFFLKSPTLNYLFGGARNLQTGQFQKIGLIPRVIDLVSTKVSDFFKSFKLPTIGGLKGKSGAFAMIKGLFNRVLSPIRAVGDFISKSAIFNNPIIRGGIAFFKGVFSKILWPLGILISGFEGIKQVLGSDEESYFGKFVDGITTAVSDFLGAPIDLLKNGFTFLLRKALGVELGDDGNVAGGEGTAGKIIQSMIDFSFEDLLKGFFMAPFTLLKGAINSIKALFKGEEDPLKFIRNPVLDILSPIINFFSDVKDWIISQIKSIPVIGDLFQSEDEKLAEKVSDLNSEIAEQEESRAKTEALIAKDKALIAEKQRELDTGVNVGIASNLQPDFVKRNLIKEAQRRIEKNESTIANSLAITEQTQAQLDQIEATKAQTDAMNNLINQLDAVATASGNGAADSFRAMQGNNGSPGGGVMATNVTDASVTNVSKSETILGEANVDPRGEVDYMNYAPNK